jgi:hypothetical protein
VASGPWFFSKQVTVKGNPNIGKDPNVTVEVTDLRLTPPFPKPPDPPISANSWVWASITEVGSDGRRQATLGRRRDVGGQYHTAGRQDHRDKGVLDMDERSSGTAQVAVLVISLSTRGARSRAR